MKNTIIRILLSAIPLLVLFAGCNKEPEWVAIFNGENLDGWTVKVSGYPAGENYKNTFVVEDGLLRVKYDEYETFSTEYAHIFYNQKLSHYRLRLEYKFNGEKVPGSKDFTLLNSGVMFHSQSAESMPDAQEFPVSIEAQFLACDDMATCDRTTMNIASPGTHIVRDDGSIHEPHMTWTEAPARHKDEWVQVEIEVHGDKLVLHKIDGVEVLRYRGGILGGNRYPKDYPIPEGTVLKDGYIALQGESHPVDFRNIELMILPSGD
ncbi:MAG: DUF1080 domain-containing protein [Puniceicoccaceae bacterium]